MGVPHEKIGIDFSQSTTANKLPNPYQVEQIKINFPALQQGSDILSIIDLNPEIPDGKGELALNERDPAARIEIVLPASTRDLYQSSTEEGEILSASRSEINTTKTLGSSGTSETGFSIGGSLLGGVVGGTLGFVAGGPGRAAAGATAGAAAGGGTNFTHKMGETSQDSFLTTTDSSRERRERFANNTSISQMYNLLTGYNTGTNRAVFIMLPRPHTLQPTDLRTFIRGVRIIEGLQEFFLIVTRPADESFKELCIETSLETAHIPENVADAVPEFDLKYEDFEVQYLMTQHRSTGAFSVTHAVNEGFIVDYDAKAGANFEEAKKRGIPINEPPPPAAPTELVQPDGTVERTEPDRFHKGVAELYKKVYEHIDGANMPLSKEQYEAFPGGEEAFTAPLPKHTGLLIQGAAHQQNDKRFGLAEYSYQAINATTVNVQGIAYTPFTDYRSYFVGRFRAFTKSAKPISKPKDLFYLDLARKLRVCIESPAAAADRCLEVKYVKDIPPRLLDQTIISVDPRAIVTDLPNRSFSTDVGSKGQLANATFGPASTQDTLLLKRDRRRIPHLSLIHTLKTLHPRNL